MKCRRLLSLLLSIFMGLFCHIPVFASSVTDWSSRWDETTTDETIISMSPGKDDSEMCFSWLAPRGSKTGFRCGTSSALSDADSMKINESLCFTGQKCCRVTVSGLQKNTQYFYNYIKKDRWSPVYSFHTGKDMLTALFVSDAQIGRSGDWKDKDVLLHDTAGWDTTLTQAMDLYPDISLCLSAGDQVEKGFSELQYRLFLAPDLLRSIPIAPVIGNHEFYYPSLFLHFNLPNRYGGSVFHSLSDEPYYFARGNALFIQLDSNDLFPLDHERVIEKAIQAYPEMRWQVVMLHHSLYSCEDSEQNAPALRRVLAPILQKYGIDLVLSGHTHRYSRSFPIWDDKVAEAGVTYLEGGCCSGCNSKACPEQPPAYTQAGYDRSGIPVYTVLQFWDDTVHVSVYASENGESVQIDNADVFPSPQSEPQTMTSFMRFLQTSLAFFGRAVSLLFR